MKSNLKSLVSLVVVVALALVVFYSRKTCCEIIVQENQDLPITTFNLTFRVGSADDPSGGQGLAYHTARLLREGGVKALGKLPARTRAELEDFLFPMAADIGVSVGKEQTSFEVTTTSMDAETVFAVLAQMLLAPEFNPSELDRIRAETSVALLKQLPNEEEEELGKAALDQAIYGKEHPYAHVVLGTTRGVSAITVGKILDFYRRHFVQKRLTIGVAGVVSKALSKKIHSVFGALPEGESAHADIPPAPEPKGLDLMIVKGPFEATGVHLGSPVSFTRNHPDFAPMYLASTAFGKHRSFVGRLMKVVREIRGLNYGTYSYVEDFPGGGRALIEPTQAARSRQAFTIWGRPTPPNNGCFLLRQLAREVTKLASEGLTIEEFELGQSHLIGFIPQLATGIERRLGYAIDSKFYGIAGDYLKELQAKVQATTQDQVTRLIKKHIHPSNMHVVVVTPDPEKFREEILGPRCDIHYAEGVVKPDEVLKEDREIATFPVRLERISVVNSEEIFQ